MITVDELINYGAKIGRLGPRWCHLSTNDLSPEGIAALHSFAKNIGLKRHWCSDHTQPKSPLHYDLIPAKRELAIAHGAIEVPALVQARQRLGIRQE